MIFLIEYDRPTGKLVTFKTFADSARHLASGAALEIELDLNRKNIQHEVVVLGAENEAAIRRTHRRYFEDIRTLIKTARESLQHVQQIS